MPTNLVTSKIDEDRWDRAKRAAASQGKGDNWALVNHIFQQMKKAETDAGHEVLIVKALPADDQHSRGPRSRAQEKSMSNKMFQEILALDVDAEFSKSDMNDEPRAEMRSRMPTRRDDSVAKGDGIDMSDDGHHGGDELSSEENDPTGNSMSGSQSRESDRIQSAGAADLSGTTEQTTLKALSTLETSEPGKGGLAGTEGLAGASFDVGGSERPSVSNGMPSESPGSTVILSEDDVDVESQMTGKTHPLESSVPHSGSGELGENDKMTRDGGDLGKGFDYGVGERARAVSHKRQAADVRLAPAAIERAARAEPPKGQSWKTGSVVYNTGADEQIAKALEDGTLQGEPVLTFQSPLVRSRCCSLCKSAVPEFLTVCPNCHSGAGGDMLQKSLGIRRPNVTDVRLGRK